MKMKDKFHPVGCSCIACEYERIVHPNPKQEFPPDGGYGYKEVDIPPEFEWWKGPSPIITTDNTNVIKMVPTVTKKPEPAITVSEELIEDLLDSIQKLKWELAELRRELDDDRKNRAKAANPTGFGQSFEETIGDEHEG